MKKFALSFALILMVLCGCQSKSSDSGNSKSQQDLSSATSVEESSSVAES